MRPTFSTEDRALLRDSVSRFVDQHYSFESRRKLLDGSAAFSEPVWLGMAELGLQGLLLSERDGGSGGGDEEFAIVMEEIGRRLLLEPYLSTAGICADLISSLGTTALRERLLPGLVSGETVVALAHGEAAMGFARAPVATRVETQGSNLRLTGAKSFVLDAPSAQLILVSAAESGGLSLFAVPREAPHLELKPWRTVDGRLAAELRLEGVLVEEGNRLGAPGGAADALDVALDRATLAVGAEALGAMQVLLDQTTAYLRTRQQFGKPLSSFQVLQHRLVDMYIAIEEVRALLSAGRGSMSASRPERQAAVSAAKFKVGQAAQLIGQQSIQLHGAIGMADELPISHFFKRLMMVDAMFGNAAHHLARFRDVTQVNRS